MYARMAIETRRIDYFGRRFSELKYLGCISAGLYVGLAGSMAAFARDPLSAVHQRQARVRILGKVLDYLFVAHQASFRANVAWGGSTDWGGVFRCDDLLSVLARSIHPPGFPESGQQCNQRHTQ